MNAFLVNVALIATFIGYVLFVAFWVISGIYLHIEQDKTALGAAVSISGIAFFILTLAAAMTLKAHIP